MDLIQIPTPLSLYLHLPWCVSKCPYCDFNSHKAGENAPFDRYVSALKVDIENEALRVSERSISSVFIGGGTPSLFTSAQIKSILDQCREHFSIISNCEITMEVNPGGQNMAIFQDIWKLALTDYQLEHKASIALCCRP